MPSAPAGGGAEGLETDTLIRSGEDFSRVVVPVSAGGDAMAGGESKEGVCSAGAGAPGLGKAAKNSSKVIHLSW